VLVGECGQLLEHRWLSGLLGVAPEGVCEVGVHRLVAFQGLDPGPPQGIFVRTLMVRIAMSQCLTCLVLYVVPNCGRP